MHYLKQVIAAFALLAAAAAASADHVHPGLFNDIGMPPSADDPTHANISTELMVTRCSKFMKKVRLDHDGHIRRYPHNYASGFCLAWINASMVFLNVRDSADAPALGVCLPEGLHSTDVIKTFLDFTARNRDDWKYNASFLVYWAMLEKYPCSK